MRRKLRRKQRSQATRETGPLGEFPCFVWSPQAHEQLMKCALEAAVSLPVSAIPLHIRPIPAPSRHMSRGMSDHSSSPGISDPDMSSLDHLQSSMNGDTLSTRKIHRINRAVASMVRAASDEVMVDYIANDSFAMNVTRLLEEAQTNADPTVVTAHKADEEGTCIFASPMSFLACNCSPHEMVGKPAYFNAAFEDLPRIRHRASIGLPESKAQTEIHRYIIGYTTLSAVAACAGLSLQQLPGQADGAYSPTHFGSLQADAKLPNASDADLDALKSDKGNQSLAPEPAPAQSTGATNSKPSRANPCPSMDHVSSLSRILPSSVVSVICRAASSRLPPELIVSWDQAKSLLLPSSGNGGGVGDEIIPVCRWVSA